MKPSNSNSTLILLLLLPFALNAQLNTEKIDLPKHSIYLDATTGIIQRISLNYEYPLTQNQKSNIYGRLSAVHSSILWLEYGPGFMVGLNSVISIKNQDFEIGAGGNYSNYDGYRNPGWKLYPYFNVGYRYQHKDGVLFRIHFGLADLGIGLGQVLFLD